MKKILFAMAAIAIASPGFAQDENTVSIDEVPQAAKDAAEANANGVTFDKVQLDNDEGTETYEFSGKMENGMMLEVDVLADGTVEEVEEQVEMDSVPSEVSTALSDNLPGFEPSMIEKSTREEGATIVYEFEGTSEGKEIDIEINEDGSGYKMNEDMAG